MYRLGSSSHGADNLPPRGPDCLPTPLEVEDFPALLEFERLAEPLMPHFRLVAGLANAGWISHPPR